MTDTEHNGPYEKWAIFHLGVI